MPVAVLIVNYRVYTDLDRALSALDPHLGAGDEVVVVDQSSEAPRLAEIGRRHPAAVLVPLADNRGFAAGVNLAARQSTAPYLMLLNPDAVVEGPVTRVLEAWLRDHPDVGVAGPRVLDEDGAVQASARKFPGPSAALAGRSTWLTRRFPDNWLSRWNLPASRLAEPTDVDWLAGSCLMTPREIFEHVGGFDEGFFLYWEDADYCRRVRALGKRCTYVPLASVRHAGGRSVAEDPAPAIRAFHRSAFRLYRKHSGAAGRLLAPLVRAGLWCRGEVLARRAQRASQAAR